MPLVDLKAAFDSVDRKILLKAMEERNIRPRLIERMKEVLGETRSRVRIGREVGDSFWIEKGLRQGYPLSPLFNILITDMEEEVRKVKWGGASMEGKRIYSLSYAENMVIITDKGENMKSMIDRLESYLDKKGLELKAKVMRFRKGRGRITKRI